MANEQAYRMIEGYMRQIDQNKKALTWLEDIRSRHVKGEPPEPILIDALNAWGRGTEGFSEAKYLLNDWLRENQRVMLDNAISTARANIRTATEQIKEWSQKL